MCGLHLQYSIPETFFFDFFFLEGRLGLCFITRIFLELDNSINKHAIADVIHTVAVCRLKGNYSEITCMDLCVV